MDVVMEDMVDTEAAVVAIPAMADTEAIPAVTAAAMVDTLAAATAAATPEATVADTVDTPAAMAAAVSAAATPRPTLSLPASVWVADSVPSRAPSPPAKPTPAPAPMDSVANVTFCRRRHAAYRISPTFAFYLKALPAHS